MDSIIHGIPDQQLRIFKPHCNTSLTECSWNISVLAKVVEVNNTQLHLSPEEKTRNMEWKTKIM